MLPKSCVSRTVRIDRELVSELKNHLIRTPIHETVSCSYGPIASNLEREKNVEDVGFAEKWAIQEQVFACIYQSSAAVLYIEVSCGELKLSDPGLLKRVLIERNMVFS